MAEAQGMTPRHPARLIEEASAAARARGVTDDLPAFRGGADTSDPLESSVRAMWNASMLTLQRKLTCGGVKRKLQMLIRSMTRFYVEPIAREQSLCNARGAEAVGEMVRLLREMEARVARLEADRTVR